MSEIHLLRCKAEPLPQLDAFAKVGTPTEIIRESFLKRPTSKVPRGAIWHIGNTSATADGSIYFALGREKIVKAHQFNEQRREFQEVEQTSAPFTEGVFDAHTQAVGVIVRPGVSLSANEVAKKLETLLESTGVAKAHNCRIVVNAIPDPQGFIETLRTAYRITRFEFDFSLPNPPDDEKFIQRPLKRFAEKSGAVEGKASIKGPDLDRETLIDVTQAVASEGDSVSANVEMSPRSGVVRRKLKSNPVRETLEADLHEESAGVILRAVRRGYQRVRGAE